MSHTKSGLISTNISTEDMLEHNLLRVCDNSINKYHSIENDTIINYLKVCWVVCVRWYSSKITKFIEIFLLWQVPWINQIFLFGKWNGTNVKPSSRFHIDWDKVTIKLFTWALNNSISEFDLRSAILIDQLYYHVVKDEF